jgi:hypothetical protein
MHICYVLQEMAELETHMLQATQDMEAELHSHNLAAHAALPGGSEYDAVVDRAEAAIQTIEKIALRHQGVVAYLHETIVELATFGERTQEDLQDSRNQVSRLLEETRWFEEDLATFGGVQQDSRRQVCAHVSHGRVHEEDTEQPSLDEDDELLLEALRRENKHLVSQMGALTLELNTKVAQHKEAVSVLRVEHRENLGAQAERHTEEVAILKEQLAALVHMRREELLSCNAIEENFKSHSPVCRLPSKVALLFRMKETSFF